MTLLETIKSPADLRKLPVERLPEVAADIRKAICDQVSVSGGHLAPNLGVVELTIAMHYVFDFAWDRLLFDVGHQCYPHKLLTGRLPLLKNLRTSAGMAGFPEPAESPYDLFRVGHAGTGISTAVGMARGDSLNGEGYDPQTNAKGRRVATIIGDASIVNGVAMEGLNGAGTLKRQFLVILNDNGMSISKPQGAIAQHFDRVRLSHTYADFKKRGKEMLKHLPGGSLIAEAYHQAGEVTKAALHEHAWFEHFGLLTAGPIDGHDFPTLMEFLTEARDLDRPMVLHVKTVKGKGFDFAEGDSSKFHSPAPFVREGCRVEIKKDGRSFTAAIGDILVDAMKRDPKILTATAAMPDGTGINKTLAAFPDRSFDTGICESHALDMMAGLAKTGWKTFFAVYSTFVQRAFDQAFQESSLQGLPVRLLLDRAGLVGGDGAVHHGFCDIALLRTLPAAAIVAPIDEPSLVEAVEFMRCYEEGLSAARYPRDNVSDLVVNRLGKTPRYELGKARCLTPELDVGKGKPDVAVLAFGTPAIDALKAADALKGEYSVSVYDARFAKPVDAALVRDLLSRNIPIVTVEDHSIIGGFGAAVLESAQEQHLDTSRIVRLGLPDSWIIQDSRARQLEIAGIDEAGITRGIRQAAALPSVEFRTRSSVAAPVLA
ncbi:MAG: 1-deoxy-D-xylulose-5-phosphate synthase [Phycisphaerales bacterium]|nr:1-deoxy-D-xylulose-5-phosphate synthase [Phycisphaerales bacterium]